MLVQLNEDFRVTADGSYNFMLQRRKVRGPEAQDAGAEYWDTVGWFPRLYQCLDRALDDLLIKSKTEGVTELRAELARFSKQAFAACRKAG